MHARSARSRLLAGAVALSSVAWSGAGHAGSVTPPTTEEALAATLKTALQQHDLDTLEQLTTWDGASRMKRRFVLFEMRTGFGRPIRSVTVEPFPEDRLSHLAAFGNLKPNMEITRQVRVVFDEPNNEFGSPPTVLFLVGRHDQEYRIALVNQVGTGDHK